MSDTSAVAIIAGAGSFPVHVAAEAKRQGLTVVGIGLSGWVDPALKGRVDAYEEVSVGQLGLLVERLKAHHATRAIMAGKVTKEVLFDSRVKFDADALGVISRVKDFSVNGLLGAIGELLAKQGIQLIDSSTFLKSHLCPAGALTARGPSPAEQEDIRTGAKAALQLAMLDVGQTVVVKNRVVVAVEALEGTDAAIARAGQVAGSGLVLVKVAAPSQDMRFDLPVLGPGTIASALAAGVTCIAVEARKTIVLEKAAVVAKANQENICIVGISAGGGCASGAESATLT